MVVGMALEAAATATEVVAMAVAAETAEAATAPE